MRSLLMRVPALGLILACGVAAVASGRLDEGQAAYQTYCADCHDTGKMEAPVTNKPGDWADRSQLWDAVLFEHAEKGYLGMPPKGGADIASNYEVKAAAEYMVTITHPQMPHD